MSESDCPCAIPSQFDINIGINPTQPSKNRSVFKNGRINKLKFPFIMVNSSANVVF